MKFSSLKILVLSFLSGGCQQQLPRTATVAQAPFQLEIQGVPQRYLNKAHAITADSTGQTTTLRLRLTSLQKQVSVKELLQQAAPADWTASQLQHALHYELDSVATLVVNQHRYPTVLATAETTVDTDHAVTLLFVFAVPELTLRQASPVQVEVSRAFFLPAPVKFTLPLADF